MVHGFVYSYSWDGACSVSCIYRLGHVGTVASVNGAREDSDDGDDSTHNSMLEFQNPEPKNFQRTTMPQPSVGRDQFSSPRNQESASRSGNEQVFLDDDEIDQPGPPPGNQHIRDLSAASSSTGNADTHPLPTRSFINKLNPQLILENSGSVARDHLANERTWLAYVRTSLAVASTGVALVQLFTISAKQSPPDSDTVTRIQHFARPLGATTVILGFMVLVLGTTRYFRIQLALVDGVFPPARKTVGFVSVMLCALVAVVFSILVSVRR